MNANLVFHWRKLYHVGLLDRVPSSDLANDVRLLPVLVYGESEHEEEKTVATVASSAAEIHIELPGHAYVSVVGCNRIR
jgi:hypothetical protein